MGFRPSRRKCETSNSNCKKRTRIIVAAPILRVFGTLTPLNPRVFVNVKSYAENGAAPSQMRDLQLRLGLKWPRRPLRNERSWQCFR
ncbi:MAG: hypothetical protein RIS94_1220 [Pseudomonadota bacterium]|jgi:hypothetical protein